MLNWIKLISKGKHHTKARAFTSESTSLHSSTEKKRSLVVSFEKLLYFVVHSDDKKKLYNDILSNCSFVHEILMTSTYYLLDRDSVECTIPQCGWCLRCPRIREVLPA